MRFINAILCEDVREEIRAKKTLVGVFSGDIRVSELPATIQVAFYFEFVDAKAEDEVVAFIKVGQSEARFEVIIPEDQPSGNIVAQKTLIRVENEGFVTAMVSINGAKRKTILKKRIEKGHIE